MTIHRKHCTASSVGKKKRATQKTRKEAKDIMSRGGPCGPSLSIIITIYFINTTTHYPQKERRQSAARNERAPVWKNSSLEQERLREVLPAPSTPSRNSIQNRIKASKSNPSPLSPFCTAVILIFSSVATFCALWPYHSHHVSQSEPFMRRS